MRGLIRAVVRFAIEAMNVVIVPPYIVGFGGLESKSEMLERNKIH